MKFIKPLASILILGVSAMVQANELPPEAVSVPTLSEWGMIILSTLVVLVGVVFSRKRQG